jgi:hypothetical protein
MIKEVLHQVSASGNIFHVIRDGTDSSERRCYARYAQALSGQTQHPNSFRIPFAFEFCKSKRRPLEVVGRWSLEALSRFNKRFMANIIVDTAY